MKDEGIRKALELAPEKVCVTPATDNPSPMSVRFSGLVALHCPPAALFCEEPPVTDEPRADEPPTDECRGTPEERNDNQKRSPDEQKLFDHLVERQAQAFQDG
jgi:hypothetical protein